MKGVKFIVIMLLLSMICLDLALGIENGKISVNAYVAREIAIKSENYIPFVSGIFILAVIIILMLIVSELIN